MVKKKKSGDKRDDEDDEELGSGLPQPFAGIPIPPEMEAIIRQLEEMFKAVISGMDVMDERMWETNPKFYGFSVTIGPDGRPRIRQFGSRHMRRSRGAINEVSRDLPIDVVENNDSIDIVAQVGSVNEGDIDLIVDGRKLVIVHKKGRFMKQVILPFKVESKPAKLEIRNGVLIATFKRKKLLPL